MSGRRCLALRLAGPLQSWGGQIDFNRRETLGEPSYSGVLGLLAAAQGRRRADSLFELLDLRLGVRVDQPGSLLRDYHTVSEPDGKPLLSTQTNRRGEQTRTSPPKPTAVTERFYLQDAAFVAVLEGPPQLLEALVDALHSPTFPLALGRRACPPARPLLLRSSDQAAPLWEAGMDDVIAGVPWQASHHTRRRHESATVRLAATVDDPQGQELRTDVPTTFDHKHRVYATRRVARHFVDVATGVGDEAANPPWHHDPFALLGW
jgi:CRISPR system Cascade subunit CasD